MQKTNFAVRNIEVIFYSILNSSVFAVFLISRASMEYIQNTLHFTVQTTMIRCMSSWKRMLKMIPSAEAEVHDCLQNKMR
jgi:hypothetical protein